MERRQLLPEGMKRGERDGEGRVGQELAVEHSIQEKSKDEGWQSRYGGSGSENIQPAEIVGGSDRWISSRDFLTREASRQLPTRLAAALLPYWSAPPG
jgi:hypothetical protein